MTGKAREHEVRIMGIGLAALALLAAVAALWWRRRSATTCVPRRSAVRR